MLRTFTRPDLRSPALLCAFAGWADAASAASGALRYLLLKRDGYRIAEFDPDSIYCYTSTRPVNLLDAARRRTLQWPELAFTAIEVPEAARDLVILVGPEPDLRWRESVDTIGSFASQLGVSQVITLGGFLAQVHYASPPSLVGSSSDPQLKSKLLELGIEESSYQGPTGFVTAVLRDAADRGVPAASIWVAAPSYLSNTSNPKLAAELLRVAQHLLGQSLWLQELESAGRDMDRRIEDALRARPDLADFLGRLSGESEPTSDIGDQPEEQEGELPSAEEVLRDLEEHLRRLKGDGDGDED